MTARTRIAFVINSIGQGGAERALSVILSAIGERSARYEVHLVLLDDLPHAREMPSYVQQHTLGGGARSIAQLYSLFSKMKPALIVSFLVRSNLASALSGRLLGIPVVACERMHLSSHLEGKHRGLKLAAFKAALKIAYRFPERLLGVSTGVTEDLVEAFGVDAARSSTIFNPYPFEQIHNAAKASRPAHLPERYLVVVGRLEPSKNILQLIDAYAAAAVPQALVILGDGALRSEVERRVADLGLSDRVCLEGFCADPFPIVARAEAYVSASLNEGFPNAMVEAMVLGRPILASDCPSGPGEILVGRCDDPDAACEAQYGLLVQTRALGGLIDGLKRIADPTVQARLGPLSAARANDFRAEVITEQYWSLFDQLARPPA